MHPKVLITGATSGIGAALAVRYAGKANLLLSGRRPSEQVASGLPQDAAYVEADQRSPEEAAECIFNAIENRGWRGLDLAVLNAGSGFAGDPAAETAETIRETLDVNLYAAIALAQSLHPLLAAAGGTLVLIGSTARRGAPAFACYAAAKAGLDGLARALAQEWHGTVAVKIIHPGPTATEIHKKTGYDPGGARRFFASPEAMARMIDHTIAGRRGRVSLGFTRIASNSLMRWRSQ